MAGSVIERGKNKQITALYNKMTANGLSPQTVRYIHMLPDMQQSCFDALTPLFENRHTRTAY